jgi:hypothetical protein
MMTAVTPPMNSETEFLNMRHDTESGATNAGSPAGREKSTEDWSPGSRSARVASSKPICNGHGRTRGALENDILKNQFYQAATVAVPLKAEIGIHCIAITLDLFSLRAQVILAT